jgi:hypothetical protein
MGSTRLTKLNIGLLIFLQKEISLVLLMLQCTSLVQNQRHTTVVRRLNGTGDDTDDDDNDSMQFFLFVCCINSRMTNYKYSINTEHKGN